ncbi:DUF6461 domain-containing protein [Actinoplanes awajinensis]|uniref:Uncharacterized protein n=1 Tax=Actinoplanes awajinensis subsp. mycoplanecinus TaxID=135947 RepID=A0A101JBE6_9ACTN|nr:DUF6461 domain-containing protein [Actinoplanes awajinensis]KUL23700.1 hypothetical protein ADL15_45320 [Actinoplanes awajinensis subsp. mycoplanecinus]
MGDEAADYYDRMLVDAEWGEAFCVTFVRGLDDAALIAAFGGDPAGARSPADLAQVLDGFRYGEEPATLVVATIGDWRVAIEINGCQGSRPEVLRRAAAAGDGVALSVFRDVSGRSEFSYLSGDRTQTVIDHIRPERRSGEDPKLLDPMLAGLPFGYEDDTIPEAAGFALAERITGVRLPFDLMEQDLPGVVLTLVPDDLVPEGGRGLAALEHPFVQRMLASPTMENVPAMAAFRARLIAEDAHLDGEPVLVAILEALEDGRRPAPELRAQLRELHERVTGDLQGMNAVQDVAAAAFSEDLSDRFSTAYAIQDSDRSLQAVVLRRCALSADRRSAPPVEKPAPITEPTTAPASSHPASGVMAKEFASWQPEKQREVSRWLARRAFEMAGLDKLDWARPALDALDRGDPLPFPDRRAVFRLISAAALVTATTGLPLDQIGDRLTEKQRADLRERIDRAPMAVITIFNTANPDPARALSDTFSTALETFDGRADDLVTELRARFG